MKIVCNKKAIAFILLVSCQPSMLFAALATVNSVGDASALNPAVSPVTAGGQVTLRSAIQYINAQGQSANTINFNIAGTGPFRFQPNPALDPIAQPVFINGYSQPGSSMDTDPVISNAVLLIEVNGTAYSVGTGAFSDPASNGLHFVPNAAGSVVSGLVINEWIGAGIFIDGTSGPGVDGCSIIGNFIGIDTSGTLQLANQLGVFINGANNTVVGNATPAGRNVFAGSFCQINAGASITTYVGNGTSIKGNLIGLDKTGTFALGNSQAGIQLASTFVQFLGQADSTIIGGSTPAERNVIAGQQVADIVLGGGTTNSSIQGNYLGTNTDATAVVGLCNRAVGLNGPTLGITTAGNTIGGASLSANLDVGANVAGINVGDQSSALTNGNFVEGNFIGITSQGVVLGNNGVGITVGDFANTIGGSLPGQGNVVSGNKGGGILVYSQTATNNLILGNVIGSDYFGIKALGNGSAGIQIGLTGGLGGSSNNTIGA